MDTVKNEVIQDDIGSLLSVLPPALRERVLSEPGVGDILEIVMDLGRMAEVRYSAATRRFTDIIVGQQDIDWVVERVGVFCEDNRAGIERTLHRISAIRSRTGRIIGITCRVGRAVFGTVDIIRDIIEEGRSILMLGKPGVGKTTKLREIARILSDEFDKRVIVVDTSNEIAGDGDIPHEAIGYARRMQVPSPSRQEEVMIEAVENHMPEVVIIDEISTMAEAHAARTIAERGVMLVATAHGQTLENIIINPTLNDLVGGIQTVTLSDDEAERRGTQKTVQERMGQPTFDVVIELNDLWRLSIYRDVANAVDKQLRGVTPGAELRVRSRTNVIEKVRRDPEIKAEPAREPSAAPGGVVNVFPYGISRNKLERAAQSLAVPVRIVNRCTEAGCAITLKNYEQKQDNAVIRDLRLLDVPIYSVKSNTNTQITNILKVIFKFEDITDENEAVEELMEAIRRCRDSGSPEELSPRNAYIRRIQHKLASSSGIASETIGNEPYRRLRIFARDTNCS
ncbi:MAG: AAA family ATPase [Abditibacteriota bacterium]|nr:AAA family ATPase [Abditibacteriota bacterium]